MEPQQEGELSLQHHFNWHIVVMVGVTITMLVLFCVTFFFLYRTIVEEKGEVSDEEVLSENAPTAEITEAERELLLTGDIEDHVYINTVSKVATNVETLEIGEGCVMSPLVLRLSLNTPLTIENKDTQNHVIAFEDENFFSVTAGRSRVIDLHRFGKEEGVYKYRCGDVSREEAVGVLYITN